MPTESNEKWQHLSRLLDQVLDLDEPERARWLELLAEGDPEMAAMVSAALAAKEREGFTGFLAGSAIDLKGIGESTLVGRQVGPYVIDAEIGRGGMGSVWQAHRTDGIYERIVAIKFVHAAWIGSAGAQRFRVEGNLLGRLDHPNIARLIDAGVLVGTQPYLILEYIEGEPIDAFCDRGKLDLEARVSLFLGVLAAVAHAHSHLIVHRDIKPSNIFVTSGGTVKPLDFGIAKLLQGEGEAALTQSSAVPLTPQYAAPEQLLGKPVTTATDVYSLAHEPVQARADTVPYRVSKFVRRHRGGVLSALLVAIGLIGTSAVALWQLYQANEERGRTSWHRCSLGWARIILTLARRSSRRRRRQTERPLSNASTMILTCKRKSVAGAPETLRSLIIFLRRVPASPRRSSRCGTFTAMPCAAAVSRSNRAILSIPFWPMCAATCLAPSFHSF